MKRNILFGLAAALCLTGMASAKAASAPTVWLDGEQMTFEVAPVIENDRTMVPYRAIFEKLGYQVGWDADTRSVTAAKGSTTMKLTIGSKTVTVNGGTVTSDTAPVIRQDRTLVPLRLVSEYSGCDVLWDKDTRTVAMYHKQAKNAMSEKLGCVTTDGDSLLVTHSNEVTNEFGTKGYSLINLSPVGYIPDLRISTVCDGIAYGNIGAVDMKTGEVLIGNPYDTNNPFSYSHYDYIQDPIRKELYTTGYAGNAGYLACRIQKDTLKVTEDILPLEQFAPPDGVHSYYPTWKIYDGMLLAKRGYDPPNHQPSRIYFDLIDFDNKEVLYRVETTTDGIPDTVFYGDELYTVASNGDASDSFVVYNYKTQTQRIIPLPHKVREFDVTENSIFYSTQFKLGVTPSLYRITRDGNLSIRIADFDGSQLKVIGNTLYYTDSADASDYQWFLEGNTDVESVHGTGVYALPTCGGTPYLVDRSISTFTNSPMS